MLSTVLWGALKTVSGWIATVLMLASAVLYLWHALPKRRWFLTVTVAVALSCLAWAVRTAAVNHLATSGDRIGVAALISSFALAAIVLVLWVAALFLWGLYKSDLARGIQERLDDQVRRTGEAFQGLRGVVGEACDMAARDSLHSVADRVQDVLATAVKGAQARESSPEYEVLAYASLQGRPGLVLHAPKGHMVRKGTWFAIYARETIARLSSPLEKEVGRGVVTHVQDEALQVVLHEAATDPGEFAAASANALAAGTSQYSPTRPGKRIAKPIVPPALEGLPAEALEGLRSVVQGLFAAELEFDGQEESQDADQGQDR